MISDLTCKLTQVIEQIPKDVLYDFLCSSAQSHEELAMALVNEFWQAEKDDYRSMVQQCLMHPAPAGIKNGDGYDWGAVAADLSLMMDLAEQKVKEGSLLDAAEIARYVMILTCAEYEADHPYGGNYTEMWWLRRKPLKVVLECARVMVTELLITGERLRVGASAGIDIDDDSQRGLIKEIVAECKPFKKSHICRMDVFLEDAQAKVLSPKRYIAWLQKKLDSMRSSSDKKGYLEKMVRFLDECKPSFIEDDRVQVWAKAYLNYFNGDILVASHLLMPQLEHALHNLLEEIVDDATMLNNDVQKEPTLMGILNQLRPYCNDTLYDELTMFLVDGNDVNYRNRLLHGLIGSMETLRNGHYLFYLSNLFFFTGKNFLIFGSNVHKTKQKGRRDRRVQK